MCISRVKPSGMAGPGAFACSVRGLRRASTYSPSARVDHMIRHAAGVPVDGHDIVPVLEVLGEQACVPEGLAGLVVFEDGCAVGRVVGGEDSVLHAAGQSKTAVTASVHRSRLCWALQLPRGRLQGSRQIVPGRPKPPRGVLALPRAAARPRRSPYGPGSVFSDGAHRISHGPVWKMSVSNWFSTPTVNCCVFCLPWIS
jgi:hypothetical protein